MRPVGGIASDEIVEPVAADRVVVDEMRLGKRVKELFGRLRRCAGQRGRRLDADRLAGVQAEQVEQSGGVGPQGEVRPGEYRAKGGLVVVLAFAVQQACFQVLDHLADPGAWPGGDVFADDAHRQR